MPEIKHTFQAGKMNKDLDERLVPNGQYRDAMNIQVRTTDDPDGDGGESGSIQNIKGNSLIGESYYATWHDSNQEQYPQNVRCVGSVADEKNDKGYFLFASPLSPPNWATELTDGQKRVYVDTIIEQSVNGQTIPVVVDVFGVVDKLNGILADGNDFSGNWSTIKTLDGSIYKPEMEIRVVDETGTNILSQSPLKIKAIHDDTILLHSPCSIDITEAGKWFVFESKRVLNFSPGNFLVAALDSNNIPINYNYITGINVIDGMLFWTDNYSEPKKVNIARCKAGTNINGVNNNFLRPSKLFVKDVVSGSYVDANTTDFELDYGGSNLSSGSGVDSYLKEEHLTVIRPAPKTAPTLIMSRGARENSSVWLSNFKFSEDSVELQAGTSYSISDPILYNTNFKKNDIINFTSQHTNDDGIVTEVRLQVIFESYQNEDGESLENILATSQNIKITIITSTSVSSDFSQWYLELHLKEKPLFETKFGRFGYRYKYSDGEYSTFSPWSELAFLPGEFSYRTDDGYNLGMVNTIRELTVKDFIPYRKPLDIIAVDILYKSTDSPNVHIISTVEKGKSPEWNKFTPDGTQYTNEILTGSLSITSDMLHRTLPSDQILRSWDNVPRYAKAQEIVGSRLVYANYTQGYNMNDINIDVLQDVRSKEIIHNSPSKSIKSMRDYKVGLVFGDKYGRETPVIASSYTVSDVTEEGYTSMTGDISVPKSMASNKNSFMVTQSWGDPNLDIIPPTTRDGGWIDYVKYYIKETSNEYYNLVMDRWYESGDKRDDSGYNNIWLSFNSADRNKIDDETFLILKNSNGGDAPVTENVKYKILAIENEAPDFIKTKMRSIGIIGDLNVDNTYLSIWPNSTDTAALNQPSQLWSSTSMEINGTTWNASGMGSTDVLHGIFGRDIEGKLELRVVGAIIVSDEVVGRHETPWKELVHFTRGESDDEDGIIKLRWEIPWTEDESDIWTQVDNLQQLGEEGYSAGLNNLQYWLEIREAVVQNKPEFEGKFFVKIKQDQYTNDNIEMNLVPFSAQQLVWNHVGTMPWRYVSSSHISGTLTESIAGGWPNVSGGLAALTEGFYEVDFNQDPPPCHHTTCTYSGTDPKAWFFGAFNEFLTPDIPSDGSYWFDIASESIDGPDSTDAADPHFPDPDDYSGDNPLPLLTWLNAYAPYFESKDLSPFGSCSVNYSTMTRNYWVEFMDDHKGEYYGITKYSKVFIDECQMASMSIIPGPHRALLGRTTGTGVGELPEEGGPFNTVPGFENGPWSKPHKGFSTGEGIIYGTAGAAGGTKGCMVLSFVSNYTSTGPGKQPPTWVEMQIPGTIFSMGNATVKYQVVGVMYQSDPNGTHATAQKNYSGDWDPSTSSIVYPPNPADVLEEPPQVNANNCLWYGSADVDADIYHEARYRHTIYVEFRRLNSDGGLSSYGMYDSEDPRRSMRHDGAGSLIVPLMYTPSYQVSGAEMNVLNAEVESFASTNGAVWETEPKGDSGLDLYYEASSALPMTLNKNNIFDFSPINSNITALRGREGDENEIELTDRRDNRRVNNAHFANDYIEHAILSIVSDDNSFVAQADEDGNTVFVESPQHGETFIHRRDFTIGDKLRFTRKDGTITQAVVKQMYKPVFPEDNNEDGVADNFTNLISEDLRYGVVSGPKAFEHAGTATKTLIVDHSDLPYNGQTSFCVSNGSLAINGGSLEIGDTIKALNYTADGITISVTFGGLENSQAPRGIQILSFPTKDSTQKYVVLSEPGGGYTWTSILSNIDSGTNISVVFQKNYGYYGIDINVWKQPVELGWNNCYSFGNGLESDRIRDDFNAPKIDNGVKVSTTLSGYKREKIGSGLIYSGLYNSKSQVNELNQFNMGEKITKDINPTYGSIQALKTRDTDVVVFAEDKILKVLANKDALFNADGNPQLTASDRVLGTAVPYAGDFGISKDPESLAQDQYRMYFTDRQRGAVLRLSQDGLTPISEIGMSTWFREQLKKSKSTLGSFDSISGEYNVTITPPSYTGSTAKTVSFDEAAKGWVSFKSFIPDNGLSYSGQYVSTKNNKIWKHHSSKSGSGQIINRNSFYGNDIVPSFVEVIFNESPSTVKSFKTINYEGSQARVQKYTGSIETAYTGSVLWQESDGVLQPYMASTEEISVTDNEYYNLTLKDGWWVPGMYTDMQQGEVREFKNKEGKWFSKVSGVSSNDSNLDSNEFTVQGIGIADSYLYTGEVINECVSGCLDADNNCVECSDPLLNDQCTNASGDVVNCNSPYCVAGPCITGPIAVFGCTNPSAVNYDSDANVDDGSCAYSVEGCMDSENPNYDPLATISNSGDCEEGVVTGCQDPVALNYNPAATQDGIFYTQYDSYTDQLEQLFDICYDNCSCLYSISSGLPAECDCVSVNCAECCSADQTWNPDLEHCVNNDYNLVCTDNNGIVVSCSSPDCAGGPCVGTGEGGESGCLDGGPDCCGPSQAWSSFSQSCEDIVEGCMDENANNYMGSNLQYQWPNNSATGFANINGITYNGLHPDTGVAHPFYNPANVPCSEYQLNDNGVLVQVSNSCCTYTSYSPVLGCTDPFACNYKLDADEDDGSCDFSCEGCMNSLAGNWDPSATQPCVDDNGIPDGFGGGCCEEATIQWCCGSEWAVNYDEFCIYHDPTLCTPPDFEPECNCVENGGFLSISNQCYGCMEPASDLYNPCATINLVSDMVQHSEVDPCFSGAPKLGCTTIGMFNYDSTATEDDGSCIPVIEGCTDVLAFNFTPHTGDVMVDVNTPCVSCCEPIVYGCIDETKSNYNPFANTSDPNNPCVGFVLGCTDPAATNYNPFATHGVILTWGGDENWDGTYEGISNNWIESPCGATCKCDYVEDPGELNVLNYEGDSSQELSTTSSSINYWILDPEQTDDLEFFYEWIYNLNN